jgi:hypothetical protein
MRSFAPNGRGLRRLGLAATMASGVTLLGVGVNGVAAIDDRLEIAASRPAKTKFIDQRLESGERPHHRRCHRDRDRPRDRVSGDS